MVELFNICVGCGRLYPKGNGHHKHFCGRCQMRIRRKGIKLRGLTNEQILKIAEEVYDDIQKKGRL